MRYFMIYQLFCCLLFVSTKTQGQTFQVFKGDTINRIDAKGQKQGLWRKYYSTDSLFSEGKYKDNIPVGTFMSYHKNGKVQAKMVYRGMTEICKAEIFAEDGKLKAKGKYINKTKDSLWTYYSLDGWISSTEFYLKGKKEGSWLSLIHI